jgi:hypothetical protein
VGQLEIDKPDNSSLSGAVPGQWGHSEMLALLLVGCAVVSLERDLLVREKLSKRYEDISTSKIKFIFKEIIMKRPCFLT